MQIFSGKKNNANKELIEQIILENYNRYYRLAYSYVHNETDAGDIVQNGAYKALRNSQALKNQEYAATWVYRIMLNECFQYLRQPGFLSYEAIQEESGVEAGYYEDEYKDIDLQRALDVLSDKDKAIIILKYFEDRTLEEIADILEENVNTVKSRLYRSMKKLREKLSDETDSNRYSLEKESR
ncbi:MAG: RNA polymerase sigma factor [Acetatifactor sp.]